MSESIDLSTFFRSISNLSKLKSIHMPRAACCHEKTKSALWPPKLSELNITGDLRSEFLPYCCNLPSSLTSLAIHNYQLPANFTATFVYPALDLLGHQLRSLAISGTAPVLHEANFDDILEKLPVIHRLSIPADLISNNFFKCASDMQATQPSPLAELEFTGVKSRLEGSRHFVGSEIIWCTLVEGGLGRLRRLRVHRSLCWGRGAAEQKETTALSLMMQARAREDGERAVVKECDAGVWMFGR